VRRLQGLAGVVLVLAVAGCGKQQVERNPIPDEKYDLARCIAWAGTLTQDFQSTTQSAFMTGILNSGAPLPAPAGNSPVWVNILATNDLVQSIGQDNVDGATQDGKSLYQGEKSFTDVSGAVGFDKMCIGTYQKLTAGQQ
jgi:hypothetical protein